MGHRRRRRIESRQGEVQALSHGGLGIVARPDAQRDDHVERALPGEQVSYRPRHKKLAAFEGPARIGELQEVEGELRHPDRVEPRCAHFERCGGCTLQHLGVEAQLAHKQRVVEELFAARGLHDLPWEAPLHGEPWGYRRKARFGARWVDKKGRALVGFRERDTRFLADLERCPVLVAPFQDLPARLGALVSTLELRARIPQIELAVGDQGAALVVRVLDPPQDSDLEKLRAWSKAQELGIYLQPGGVDSLVPLEGGTPPAKLKYALERTEVRFEPLDFIQVNAPLNRRMVAQSMAWLEPQKGERALDLFCGLGNFSLELAALGTVVHGVEGEESLVARARANAESNGISAEACSFEAQDLYGDPTAGAWWESKWDLLLLDPPRSGAELLSSRVVELGASRIVYVACDPKTLARDAAAIVEQGYRLSKLGIMDMFVHTAHIETMALFVRTSPEEAGEPSPAISQSLDSDPAIP